MNTRLSGPVPPGDGGFPHPRRLFAADPGLGAVLNLMRAAFAEMEGRIDPPSSIHRLTLGALAREAGRGEVWALGDPPLAAAILTPDPPVLRLGKIATHASARRQGLARQLVGLAAARAWAQGLDRLELQSRVELSEAHAAFRALGFVETGRTAHPGYDRPTSITFARPLA